MRGESLFETSSGRELARIDSGWVTGSRCSTAGTATGASPIWRRFCDGDVCSPEREQLAATRLTALRSSVADRIYGGAWIISSCGCDARAGFGETGWSPYGGQWCAVLEMANEVNEDGLVVSSSNASRLWARGRVRRGLTREECGESRFAPRISTGAGRRDRGLSRLADWFQAFASELAH